MLPDAGDAPAHPRAAVHLVARRSLWHPGGVHRHRAEASRYELYTHGRRIHRGRAPGHSGKTDEQAFPPTAAAAPISSSCWTRTAPQRFERLADSAAEACLEAGALDVLICDTEERSASVWSVRAAVLEAMKADSRAQEECDVVVPGRASPITSRRPRPSAKSTGSASSRSATPATAISHGAAVR